MNDVLPEPDESVAFVRIWNAPKGDYWWEVEIFPKVKIRLLHPPPLKHRRNQEKLLGWKWTRVARKKP